MHEEECYSSWPALPGHGELIGKQSLDMEQPMKCTCGFMHYLPLEVYKKMLAEGINQAVI